MFEMNMCGVSTEFLHLTAGNFETYLASDDVLADFFNDFLSLPSFTESLHYSRESGLFELLSGADELVLHCQPQPLTSDSTVLTGMTTIDNQNTVYRLNREQGIQWIVKERLPFFLQSDCYIKYRLAKLLFQQNPNLYIQRGKSSSGSTIPSASPLHCPFQVVNENTAQRAVTCSHSLESTSSKQEGQKRDAIESSRRFSSINLKCEKLQELKNPQTELSLYFTEPQAENPDEQHLQESSSQNVESSELQLKYLATRLIKNVLNNALNVMDDQSQANISECLSKTRDQTNCTSKEKSCECKVCQCPAEGGKDGLMGKKEKVQEGNSENGVQEKLEWDKKNREVGSKGSGQENVPGICCRGAYWHDSRPGLDNFKEFLQGTPGEKLINLWMDIEKLKILHHRERKNRFLVLIRSRYLLSSSQSSLNAELLSRLGLCTSPCWTEEKLCSVQPCLTEALLCYWAPRFWMSQCVLEDYGETPNVGVWTEQSYSPLSDRQSYHCSLTLHPLYPDTCLSQFSHIVQTQVYSSRRQLQDSRRMEKMLQALCFDSYSGWYFTHFCEQSGNQLWENAVYFWTDLQHYHELFYQDGLDPYRVQREAQVLYSTYLYSSARRSIGLDEKIRKEVYDRLMPAFEELFDKVEEHTLNILLEPWTLLVSRDKESFHKVRVEEEVRRGSSECPLKQMEHCGSIPHPSSVTHSASFVKAHSLPESWSSVSPHYQGYRLGSLLRHRHEIGHFMSFLQNQDASIHLTCWLDLEQYRRTPQKDKAIRQERSSHIAAKYLNRNYFFGPDSPASADQQNDILHLAGGLERLKLDCASNPVVVEIQDIVRNHIERTWLPQFLSTAEFEERQKHKPKAQAADRLSQHVYCRRRRRRESWKAEGLWMSSSKEILLFRQILLNPVTCMQFQHFVSLKGDFLENDVLFWLEVQRYKDLCHSHSDEATIQQKISTIISCFINSSMPPSLQIDIPPEQAQHILEKRYELGPYIFREAQMSVFSELLKFWPEFQELCKSVQKEQLLPLLQEKRVKHRAKVRRQRRKEEEEDERMRTQEELEMEESSFREEEDTDDDMDHTGEELEEINEKKPSRTQSRVLLTPTQPLSWSYSKYMTALKREEMLLRRHSQLKSSFSTASDSSFTCSIKSAGSKHSHRRPSRHSSAGAGSKQCDRSNRK